jgi:two-component system cell cycle response regulator DivK
MALILVVEDDPANQEIVTRFLRRKGHTVIHAEDGLSGVKAARERIPDLILMDLGLPLLDGWGAAQRIRADARTAHIPVIALTAHAFAEDVNRAIDVQIDAYETKPVVYERLLAKIATFIRE